MDVDSPLPRRPQSKYRSSDVGFIIRNDVTGSPAEIKGNTRRLGAYISEDIVTYLYQLEPIGLYVPNAWVRECLAACERVDNNPQAIGGFRPGQSQRAFLAGVLPGFDRCEYVAFIDTVNGTFDADWARAVISVARVTGAAVAAYPLVDTIKITDASGRVHETPDRSKLRRVGSPYVARRDWLATALQAAKPAHQTLYAALVDVGCEPELVLEAKPEPDAEAK